MATPTMLLAVTGASGAIYARRLLGRLIEREAPVGLTLSEQGFVVARAELGMQCDDPVEAVLGQRDGRVVYYPHDRFDSPFATGSQPWDAVVIVPCSMGTVGRIAAGVSNDLITRAADVALKERRQLILVPRETPLSLIHLRNLTALAEAGAVILPPSPGFYDQPQTLHDLVDFVAERIMRAVGK
ncbi:MAG TPA: UbiX family flavin prenyltransferase [Armatimonadota bacterium]|nr:UbiX family flavin prenyltransferase [Armatimonadota bacterium]